MHHLCVRVQYIVIYIIIITHAVLKHKHFGLKKFYGCHVM